MPMQKILRILQGQKTIPAAVSWPVSERPSWLMISNKTIQKN